MNPRHIAILIAVVALLPLTPARAQRAQAQDPPTGSLRLASKTPWVSAGQELAIRVVATSSAAPADVELAVSVYRQVSSRSEFLLTLQDRIRGTALTATATPLSELVADPGGALTIRLPVQDPALPPDRDRLRLRDEGVYPVRVELREAGGGRSIDRFTTHLVYASPPTEGGVPLGFAWVLPFSASPALKPNGGRTLGPPASERLAALAQGLDAQPGVPLSLAPNPETVEALATSAREADVSTVDTLKRAIASRHVVGGGYVPVDPGAFGGSGGEDEFAAQLDRGSDVLTRDLGARPDSRTWVADDRVDDDGLDRLRNQQVDQLVLPDTALTPTGLPVTLAQPFDLQSRSLRKPIAAAVDTDLSKHFTVQSERPDDPVLRAHALLADLAVVYFDRPGKPRAVVARSPRNWAAERPFLEAVLSGLSASPIVKGITLDQLFATVPKATTSRNAPLTRSIAPGPSAGALPLSAIRTTRNRLEAFGTMLDADNPLDDALEEVLLTSESIELQGRQRGQYLDGVDRRINAEVAKLQVPASRTITLTARRGDIPVTIQWRGDYPIRLRLKAVSDKLTFPGGGGERIIEVPAGRNTTERFAVEARTSGAFPLRITLESPERGLVLARARFTVRSTAASGVGIALSVGAGVILLTWWARHLVRGRRNRRLVPA